MQTISLNWGDLRKTLLEWNKINYLQVYSVFIFSYKKSQNFIWTKKGSQANKKNKTYDKWVRAVIKKVEIKHLNYVLKFFWEPNKNNSS